MEISFSTIRLLAKLKFIKGGLRRRLLSKNPVSFEFATVPQNIRGNLEMREFIFKFPEEELAKSSLWSLNYSQFIRGRFPLGEPIIKKNPHRWVMYLQNLEDFQSDDMVWAIQELAKCKKEQKFKEWIWR